ncbi:PREDICTED: substance-K receptor [Gekko japonicus]|uniref:Substance-K receptor n=1 Tax=Gekko japonicus TaxID=146911 RepID=A0ABM1LD37_GEKJA|nr:PREDICTED: substance-K receptor [Gekko japonicus]
MKTASFSDVTNISLDGPLVDDGNQTAFHQPGWQIALWAITYLSIVIASVVGNSIVIWIILSHRRMRTVTNYFIVNLALSDLLNAGLNTVFNFIYACHNVWYFGEGFCRFLNLVPITAMFVSIYSMTAVAAERYVAIIYPFKRKLSAGNTKVIIGAVWLVAFGLAFPQFFYAKIIIDNGTTKCVVAWPDGTGQKHKMTYHITVIVLTYLIPLMVMFVTYSIIGMTLWNNSIPGDHTNKVYYQHQILAKKRFVRTMVAVVITFAISWFPYHIYFILNCFWEDIYEQKYIQQVYLAVFLLAMSSTMYNPIIYCCLNQRFRSGFRIAFQWCPCIKATPGDRLNLTYPLPLHKPNCLVNGLLPPRKGMSEDTYFELLQERQESCTLWIEILLSPEMLQWIQAIA